MNNFSPWGGRFHLYLRVLFCRLETFATVSSSLSLVQILHHDSSEQCVCCTTATVLGQAEEMVGGLGTPGAVCRWCVSPSPSLTKWMHCPSKTLDVYTKIRAWERGWICKSFVGLACVEGLPLLYTRLFPQFCWSALHSLERKQEQGDPAEQLSLGGFSPFKDWVCPSRRETFSLQKPGHQFDASASPWSQPVPFPSQTMAAFVVHSQAPCPTSVWREGLYSTCCQHGFSKWWFSPLCELQSS